MYIMIREENLAELKNVVFSLTSISFHQSNSNKRYRRRFISDYTLVYVKQGKGKLTIDDKNFLVVPSQLFLLCPDNIIEADSQLGSQFYIVTFSLQSIGPSQKTASPFLLDSGLLLQNNLQIISFLEKIYEIKDNQSPIDEWQQQLLFQEFILNVVKENQAQQVNGDTNLAIEQVIDYMNAYYMEDFALKDLAKKFGLSQTNFSKLFKNYVGMKPIEYLTQLRIQKAKNLLSFNFRLKEVAKSVGYNDELYFSRAFKKAVGMSPTIYMKKSQRRIVTLTSSFNDYIITLDIQPVATLFYEGKSQINGCLPHIVDKMSETKIIGKANETNYEALVKVNPDLILGTNVFASITNNLNKIAPTIVTPIKDNWKELLIELSAIVDRKDQAKRWLYEYEQKVARAKNVLSKTVKKDETVMILIATNQGFRVYGGKRQLGAILYNELGLTPPKGISLKTHFEYKTINEIKSINSNHIFLSTWASNACEDELRQLKESDSWSSLVAVKKNQVYEIEHWLNFHTPLANSIAIDRTLECLLKTNK